MKKAQHNLIVITKALPKFSCYLFAPASMAGTLHPPPPHLQGVSPVLVGKGEDAEILQAHDGPAGPGGEVGLETGLDQRVIFGLGRYQWAPPVHKAPCVLDRVGPKGVLVRYSEGWGHFSGGMLFLHVLWGGLYPFLGGHPSIVERCLVPGPAESQSGASLWVTLGPG